MYLIFWNSHAGIYNFIHGTSIDIDPWKPLIVWSLWACGNLCPFMTLTLLSSCSQVQLRYAVYCNLAHVYQQPTPYNTIIPFFRILLFPSKYIVRLNLLFVKERFFFWDQWDQWKAGGGPGGPRRQAGCRAWCRGVGDGRPARSLTDGPRLLFPRL